MSRECVTWMCHINMSHYYVYWCDTLMRHIDETHWWDTLMRHINETHWWDTLMWHMTMHMLYWCDTSMWHLNLISETAAAIFYDFSVHRVLFTKRKVSSHQLTTKMSTETESSSRQTVFITMTSLRRNLIARKTLPRSTSTLQKES